MATTAERWPTSGATSPLVQVEDAPGIGRCQSMEKNLAKSREESSNLSLATPMMFGK